MQQCPIVYPSVEEFSDFYGFVHELDKRYKLKYGMVKIVPPKEWNPRCLDYSEKLDRFKVNHPIQQNLQGASGYYEASNIIHHKMSFKNYKKYSDSQSQKIQNQSIQERQRLFQFWKTLSYSSPIYGADLQGSLMDSSAGSWNFNSLDSLARHGLPKTLSGVTTPYCYIGTWKSFFCWHKQDLDLSAINYLFQGQPKVWYSIAYSDSKVLESQAQEHFASQYRECNQFLRHKTFLINPYVLKQKYSTLKISKTLHKKGQIMVVFGGSYHTGFNCGFNIAEAVNYGTLDWLNKLLVCKSCPCQKKSVKASKQSILYNLEESSLFEKIYHTRQFQKLRKIVKKQQQMEDKAERIKPKQRNRRKQSQKQRQRHTINQRVRSRSTKYQVKQRQLKTKMIIKVKSQRNSRKPIEKVKMT